MVLKSTNRLGRKEPNDDHYKSRFSPRVLNPGAFSSTGSNVSLARVWLNYSFGMLSTVGYSGVVPATPLAHTLGSAEAVTGQLYLAVLVARLVGMQLSAELKDGR